MENRVKVGNTSPSRWITRRDLAVAYFPGTTKKVAVARLNRWIATDPEFRTALQRHGYRSRIRSFSPSIVNVFRRFLG